MNALEIIKEITKAAKQQSKPSKVHLNVTVKNLVDFKDSLSKIFDGQTEKVFSKGTKSKHPFARHNGYLLFFIQDKKQVADVACKQVGYEFYVKTITLEIPEKLTAKKARDIYEKTTASYPENDLNHFLSGIESASEQGECEVNWGCGRSLDYVKSNLIKLGYSVKSRKMTASERKQLMGTHVLSIKW